MRKTFCDICSGEFQASDVPGLFSGKMAKLRTKTAVTRGGMGGSYVQLGVTVSVTVESPRAHLPPHGLDVCGACLSEVVRRAISTPEACAELVEDAGSEGSPSHPTGSN